MTVEARLSECSVSDLARDLLATTSRLIEVLRREIDLLRVMDPRDMQAVQQEKIVLAAAYEARLKALREAPAAADDLDPALREALWQATAQFQDVLAANQRMLGAAKQAADSLLGAIVEAVQKQQRTGAGYSAAGVAGQRSRAPASPVALDQRL